MDEILCGIEMDRNQKRESTMMVKGMGNEFFGIAMEQKRKK